MQETQVTQTGGTEALRPDGRRVAIHPLDVKGRFISARRIVFALLLVFYIAAPLVKVGGHPMVHFDVDARRFYLFGGCFNAQDVWIVLFMVTGGAFSLLFLTALYGRVWCGWGCPQTVFLEAIYRPIERMIEGSRRQRLKNDASSWSVSKVGRAVLKHALYVVASLGLAHVALALFTSVPGLVAMVRQGPSQNVTPFVWAMSITGLLYFNFGWFREQLCIVLCPYGRLQSLLHDRDSIVVGYDAKRGEPRAPKRRLAVVSDPPAGDCIDCKKCVWACPTGIDIRHGLQMECLACAQCIDVCDEVMDKIGRPRGLVRYTSLNELAGDKHRVLRPRLIFYGVVMGAALFGLVLSLFLRSPFEMALVRQPGVPWVIEGPNVRNQFDLHLTNKGGEAKTFVIRSASSVPADVRFGQVRLGLPALGDVRVPVVVQIARRDISAGMSLELVVTAEPGGETRREPVRFIAPLH
jgi:cytochrome c oxidase accessory protein FixG